MYLVKSLISVFEGLLHFYAYLLVAKYIFFEKGLKDKMKFTYYLAISVGIIVGSFISPELMGNVPFAALVMWMILQRKERKFWGVALSFPIIGIVNGLLVPIVLMPPLIFDSIKAISSLYSLVMQGTLAICCVVFTVWLEKKNSNNLLKVDSKLGSEMDLDSHNRQLSYTEKLLLYFVGVFEIFFTIVMYLPFNAVAQMNTKAFVHEEFMVDVTGAETFTEILAAIANSFGGVFTEYAMKTLVFMLGVATFFMTTIVIVIVLVGNKRSFYHNRVADMQFNVIVTMADIVENRDADTGGHIQRTAKYIEIIANQMRSSGPYMDLMTPKFMEDIKIAAPLHDIGKIHVPDSILNFPGRLSEEQFAIMKTHAIEGRNLLIQAKQRLGDFSYLDVSIDMAGYHHEWWDGSSKGYPTGLAGEQIPLCARIMAVADVFDALTAKRVYKDPMPVEKAIDIILSEKGTHFDPVVIDAFMAAIEDIKRALKEFENSSKTTDAPIASKA